MAARNFKVELLCAVVARRRFLAAALAAIGAASMGGQGPQGPKAVPVWQSFSWPAHVARLTHSEFKLRYRLDIKSFNKLADMLRKDLMVKDEHHARINKWGELIAVETKLAIGLRFVAGGDPLDLKLIYDVDKSYIYRCVWRMVDALNKNIVVTFPLRDIEALKVLEAEFRAASRQGVWSGQVGAVDGVHFPMEGPTKDDVVDPMKYYVARKGEYALLTIAVCDYARRFTFWDISQVPTTHDSLAWAASDLGKAVTAGELPEPFFINGDAAFAMSPSMVTPSGIDDVFDFEQSSNRMPIECAFGILVQRFPILHRPLRVKFARRAPLIAACMRLHNFCIDERISEDTLAVNGLTNVQPGRWTLTPIFDRDGRPVDYLNTDSTSHDVRRAATTTAKTVTRDRLITAIGDAGLERPQTLPVHMHRRTKGKRGRSKAKGASATTKKKKK